ncbi:hypothetical protein FKP32DRAFT_1587066 [Trametes sanguinea]|nr:hypothetical protein FKP32DRAFT_1587066 [Trametes sanguinea]
MAPSGLKNLFSGRIKPPDANHPAAPQPSERDSSDPNGQISTSSRSRSSIVVRFRLRWPRPAHKRSRDSPSSEPVPSEQPVSVLPTEQALPQHSPQPEAKHSQKSVQAGVPQSEAARPMTEPQSSSLKGSWPKTVVNGLKLALEVAEKAGAAFPPLQAIAGSLVLIAKAVEQTSSNADDIHALQTYIEQLNKAISPEVLPSPDRWTASFSKRLADLESDLKKIEHELDLLVSVQPHERFLSAQERAGNIDGLLKSLGVLVQAFTRVEENIPPLRRMHAHIDEGVSLVPGLHPTLSAMYNDCESGRSECEPETRMEALATIYAWILGHDHPDLSNYPEPVLDISHDRLIMWLYALAGAGKSTISMTTAQWCSIRRILAATFFCARDGNRSNVLAIMPTIAYQLARMCAIFREALRKAVADNLNVHQMSVASQLEKLIIEPLRTAIDGGSHAFDNAVIIVDALDECTDDEAISVVVKSLALHHKGLGTLRILVTSRPDPHIKAGFVIPALAANTQEFPLSQIPDELTARDISLFLRRRLEEIALLNYLGAGWPSEDSFRSLVRLAELLFIFAATAVRFIGDVEAMDPAGRLLELLQAGGEAAALGNSRKSPFWILDALYLQVLASVRKLRRILGVVVLAKERLGPAALEALLELRPGTARPILILPAPGDDSSPIRLIHLSFTNFIVDPSRCTDPAFLHHCLRILGTLRHNICEVDPKDQHLLNSEIPILQDKIAQHLPPDRQYAVKYWVYHLVHAEVDQRLLDELQAFCDSHLLDWLEALSLMGCVHVAVAALQSAQLLLKKLPLPLTNVVALLYDCERIVRAFYEGISASFFEVLRATSTFAPENSLLRQRHAANLPGMVQLCHGRDTGWSATLTSTDIGSSDIRSLDISPDGSLLACGTGNGTIQFRSVQTGAEVHAMEGHGYSVMSLSFSPDGKALLSGDVQGSVKLWDVITGACLGTWKRHSKWVSSVAWSSDGKLAASGSHDETVRLWSVASPEESTELSGHQRNVLSVVFAADGTLLAGSGDQTCKVWDTHTKSLVQTLVHDSAVWTVAVSPNSQLVACGLGDGRTVLWIELQILPGSNRVCSLAFYGNDTLAVAYRDSESSLTLWDVNKQTPLKVFPGSCADSVWAAAFSSDGIHIAVAIGSALDISKWPMDAPGTLRQSVEHEALSSLKRHVTGATLEDSHKHGQVHAVSFSRDGRRIVAVLTHVVALLEASTGAFLHTLKHETNYLNAPIAWSSSANFAAWAEGGDVCVWDTEPGGRVRTLTGHSYDLRDVHFTPNEQHVLSASEDGTIRRWNAIAVSSDGEWMISGSTDRSPPDTSSPDLLAKPSREPFRNRSRYPTLRLHDAAGRVLWIEHVPIVICSLAFSDDCTRAVAGLWDGRILLYDLTQLIPPDAATSTLLLRSGKAPTVPEYELSTEGKESVRQIAFSPDDRGLVSERCYIPLDVGLRPLSSLNRNISSLPAYFFADGWIWCFGPATGPQPFIRHEEYSGYSWSIHGDTIACGARDQGVVVLDASPCYSRTRAASSHVGGQEQS